VLVKKALVGAMEKAVPEYKYALNEFKRLSPAIDAIKNSKVGELSGLKIDRTVETAVKKLFSPTQSSPEMVAYAKQLIAKENPKAWDAAVRVHLQTLFESTKKSATGGITNIGGHFYKKVAGDLSQIKILKAAMEPEHFKTISEFMEVLESAGVILGKESATATRQAMMEEIGGKGLRSVVRAWTRPLVTKEKVIGDRMLESILYGNARKLADAMVSEKAAVQLSKIKHLGPKSELFIPALTTFLAMVKSGAYSREKQRGKISDVQPPILKEQQGHL